jgi:hypothetical protein
MGHKMPAAERNACHENRHVEPLDSLRCDPVTKRLHNWANHQRIGTIVPNS